MPRSQANNRIFPLVAGGTFTGVAESTAAGVAVSVSVLVPTECTLTIEQSYDKATWFISEQYPIPANAHKTVQQAVGLEYFRVILLNNGITQTFCHLISTLSTSLTQNVNIRNLEASRDTVDISGNVMVEFPAVQDISGSVSVLNFPAVQDISGTVLCFGLDCTNPPATTPIHIRDERLLVDVSGNVGILNFPAVQDVSGSVIVSNFPAVQDISGSVIVSNFPALQDISGSVIVSNFPAVQDISGSVIVSNFPAVQDVSGSVVIPHLNKTTDSVDISGQTIVTSRTTSSVTTFENNASIISFSIITTTAAQQIKGSAGSLISLTVYNDSNAINYILLYNALAANVVIGTTPIVAVIALKKADVSQIQLHSVYFSTAISFVAASASDGTANPSGTGVFVTALYDN